MLLIGELAQRAGMAPSAIRYYEEIGLVEPAGRESGRRLFPESMANRLRAITAAQEAGFTLEEIRRLLNSQAEGRGEWRALVEAKIDEVEARLDRLRTIAATLRESLTCGCRAWDECPIVLRSSLPSVVRTA
jgi:MerR family redox-sensitive transcriptional activator SoxR